MRIAMTGGTGYVGAHILRGLMRAGHEVCLLAAPGCADDPVIGHLTNAGDLTVTEGDIRDGRTVDGLLADCDAVLHAAGVVGTDRRRAELMWQINARATESVLTRAVEAGLDPVVSVSSYSALFPSPNGIISAVTLADLDIGCWRSPQAAIAASFGA